MIQPIAGPSTIKTIKTIKTSATKQSTRPAKRRKLPPPAPLPIHASTTDESNETVPIPLPSTSRPNERKKHTLPIKTMQGTGSKRTDGGRGREWVYVRKSTGLGVYLGRCKGLICDEGYTHLVLYALGAAIPKALILLHALLDVLPYPKSPRGAWYEIMTGSTACVDEVEEGVGAAIVKGGKKAKGNVEGATKAAGGQTIQLGVEKEGEQADGTVEADSDVLKWLDGIGGSVADELGRVERLVSSIQIHIHIGPRAATVITGKPEVRKSDASAQANKTPESKPGEGRSRPSKKKRVALAAKRKQSAKGSIAEREGQGGMEIDDGQEDEEAMMNANALGDESEEEEEEQVEER